jgi:hypothetical protein
MSVSCGCGSHAGLDYLTSEKVQISTCLDILTSEKVPTLAPKTRERRSSKTHFLPVGNLTRKSSFSFLPVGNWTRFYLTID